IVEALDIADLRENAGGVDRTDPGNRLQRIRNSGHDALDGSVQFLDLSLDTADRLNRRTENEIDGIFDDLGEAVRRPGGLLNALGYALRVGESVPAALLQVICKIHDIHGDDLLEAI